MDQPGLQSTGPGFGESIRDAQTVFVIIDVAKELLFQSTKPLCSVLPTFTLNFLVVAFYHFVDVLWKSQIGSYTHFISFAHCSKSGVSNRYHRSSMLANRDQ